MNKMTLLSLVLFELTYYVIAGQNYDTLNIVHWVGIIVTNYRSQI